MPPVDIDHVAILDSVPVGTPQIAGVPESLHFWLQRTRVLPPQEIYAVTGGGAREKIRKCKMTTMATVAVCQLQSVALISTGLGLPNRILEDTVA